MSLEEELSQVQPKGDTLLSIGIFDGVHLGHQHLLRHLIQRGRALSLVPGAVTFSRHPRSVLSPQGGVSYLISLEERTARLREVGMEVVVALAFTLEVASLGAEEFLRLLQQRLRMRGLVIGPDFALGRGREGDAPRLRELSQKMGFLLEAVGPVQINGEVVSSTAIRQALSQGEVGRVARLLGRPLSLMGKVVPGDQRGRTLGFPTANLSITPEIALPADGVYATLAHLPGLTLPSVTNIGLRPTFGSSGHTVEVFLLNYQGDLYGQELAIELIERLRGEKRFDSPQGLAQQIEQDVRQARQVLALKK